VRTPCLVGILLAGAAAPLPAQRPLLSQPLDTGVVVRLHLGVRSREDGRLVSSFAPDSTVFRYCRWPARPCAVGDRGYVVRPASAVVALEIRRGSYARVGGVVGCVVGAGVALFVLGGGFTTETGSTGRLRGLPLVASSAASFVTIGAIGAMIGSAVSRWELAP
jgi:hypothetical protein